MYQGGDLGEINQLKDKRETQSYIIGEMKIA